MKNKNYEVAVINFEGINVKLVNEYMKDIINGQNCLSQILINDEFHADQEVNALIQSALTAAANLYIETGKRSGAYLDLSDRTILAGFEFDSPYVEDPSRPALLIDFAVIKPITTIARLLHHFDSFDEFVTKKLDGEPWHIEHTGGGCMVAFIDVKLRDGSVVSLGVNDESVGLYRYSWLDQAALEKDWEEHTFLDWSFGDDPGLLMHELAEYLDPEINISHLIDQIYTVAKSNFV